MRFLISCFFILLAVTGEAQVLTHKHKARLETVTDSARRARLLKRYLEFPLFLGQKRTALSHMF
ncbi:MAG: hypothetical protein AAGA64_03930 [Bacteroidota bacterium]